MKDEGWVPTHLTPSAGVAVWTTPDADQPPAARLVGGTPLRVLERRGAWAGAETGTGATGWVDAGALELHPDFEASHHVLSPALALRAYPDPALEPIAHIDELTAVQLLEPYGQWSRIRTADALDGWVEGRHLQRIRHKDVGNPTAPDRTASLTEMGADLDKVSKTSPQPSAPARRRPLLAAAVLVAATITSGVVLLASTGGCERVDAKTLARSSAARSGPPTHLVGCITLDDGPFRLTSTAEGLYSKVGSEIVHLDPRTGSVVARLETGRLDGVDPIDIVATDEAVYGLDLSPRRLLVLDPDTLAVRRRVSILDERTTLISPPTKTLCLCFPAMVQGLFQRSWQWTSRR